MTDFDAPDLDEYPDPCDELGRQHVWGRWTFSAVATHEIRFCQTCGVMESQSV